MCFATPEALYQAQYRRLVRVLSVVAGNREDAEDAVQEAFVQLFLHWDRIRAYEDQAAWVRRVAINRLRNRQRSLGRLAAALLRLGDQTRRQTRRLEPPERLDLASALRDLPERQRLVVALYYVDDLPVAQIAASLGISTGTVAQHLQRGRKALRKKLGVE